ncbi:MAG: hypothetical protein PHT54_03535 [Candidatus Nanoarchaeia archaeon]|nr:hypothetical protein [Candidatus Nanoarchaeia archaeon]
MPRQGNIKEIKQINFWSGMVNDPHSILASGIYYTENLKVGDGKSLKQVVNNQSENACGYNVNNYVTKVIISGGTLYALGQNNATDKDTTIWTKSCTLTGMWGTMAVSTISNTTFRAGDSLFASINNVLFMDGGTDYIAKYTIAGNTMNGTWKAMTGGLKGGTIWQGRIYGWDVNNYIYEIDPVADTLTQKILIPAEQTPVQIVPFGNLLAIICTSSVTVSKAYLWDGVANTTFTEILNIGYGDVSGGGILEGILYAIINSGNARTLKIKKYAGGLDFSTAFTYSARPDRAKIYAYIKGASKVKSREGFIYFIITGTKPDGTYASYYEYAIARYGRNEPVNPMTFSIYKTLDFTSARGINGQTNNNDFEILENILGTYEQDEKNIISFINSDTNKTTEFISSINDFSGQSGIIETFKFNGDDNSKEKRLMGVSAFYSSLSSTGQVVMKYRKDEETSWTQIFSDSTDNALSYQANCIEGTWAVLPTFKEIQLRFEIKGGTEFTGYKIKYEELPSQGY